MLVPTLTTVKQIEADWAGGPAWEIPRPLRPDEGGTGKLSLNASPSPVTNTSVAEGTLVHHMPGPLEDAVVMIVRRVRMRPPSDFPIFDGNAYKLTYAWEAGKPLDLRVLTMPKANEGGRSAARTYLDRLKPAFSNDNLSVMNQKEVNPNTLTERLTALAFFSQLQPPQAGADAAGQYAAQRSATHTWDLSMWFTQPCIIIVGHLGEGRDEAVGSPVPLMVDGKPVPAVGRTVVRWIYPLPDDPPGGKADEADKPADETTSPGTASPEAPPAFDGNATVQPRLLPPTPRN
jgi:hypothetical protein